jgi:hypothetical protein
MAILDDILSALGGAADSSGLSGVLQDIGTAARDSAREERRSLDFIESLPPIARSILQNEAMSMGYSNVEEAMMFQPGIMNARATELAKYYLTPAEEPQPPMKSDEIRRTELPNPVPKPEPPVQVSPLPSLNREDILTLEELGSIRRGVQSDIANQRKRYEEEQAEKNMSAADLVQRRVRQRPRLGGVGGSISQETAQNIAAGMGLNTGQNDDLNTLINMIGAEDPQLANYMAEGFKEGAIGTASEILLNLIPVGSAAVGTMNMMKRMPLIGRIIGNSRTPAEAAQALRSAEQSSPEIAAAVVKEMREFFRAAPGVTPPAPRPGLSMPSTALPSSAQKTMKAAEDFRSGFPGRGIYNAGGPIRRMGGGTMRDKILNNYNRMV